MKDMTIARKALDSGDYTCVLCRDGETLTATQRGVRPLLDWLDSSMDLTGFSAADRVVGRGAAFLYCLLGVKAVYARVMSHPAAEVLEKHGISATADTVVPGIINHQGTGPCPIEEAVLAISDPSEALTAIRARLAQLQKGV